MLARTVLPSPLGPLTVDASEQGVRAVWFDPDTWPEADPVPAPVGDVVDAVDQPVLREAADQLDAWFAGDRDLLDVPLDLGVRGFAREVLVAMTGIPFGEVRSYGALAASLGRDAGSARAVGRACNANPMPIIVPCHRVIASDGSLGGYAGGLEIKRWLLTHEGAGAALPHGGWQTRAGRDRSTGDTPTLF